MNSDDARNKGVKSGLDEVGDIPFPLDDFWNFGGDGASDDIELDEDHPDPLSFDGPGGQDHEGLESGINGSGRSKRRRPSASLETADKAAPPPSWHSQAADKPHRRDMICEIALLLKARKKRPPSQEWLHQLPSKAKRLEEGLYLKAPSLEAYLDRKTLKTRLKDLAESIVKDHQEWKKRKITNPAPSSMAQVTSRHPPPAPGNKEPQQNQYEQLPVLAQSNQMLRQMSANNVGSQSSIRQGDDSFHGMAPSPYDGRSSINAGTGSSGVAPADSQGSACSNNVISELEQQRAVNERLKNEIDENIRRQHMLIQQHTEGNGIHDMNGQLLGNAGSNFISNIGMPGNMGGMQMMSNPPMNSNMFMQAAIMNQFGNGQLNPNHQLALMQSMTQGRAGNSSVIGMGAGNQNLVQQGRIASQLDMLRGNMAAMTSQMPGMHMQGQAGFNPTMPPPSAVSRNALAGGPRGPNDLDPSLSPNSFNW